MKHLTIVIPIEDDTEVLTTSYHPLQRSLLRFEDNGLATFTQRAVSKNEERERTPLQAHGTYSINPIEELTEREAQALAYCRDELASDELSFDEDAKVSSGDYGVWVQGWVYVNNTVIPDA